MKVYPGHLKTVQFEHATHEETRAGRGVSTAASRFQTTGFMLNDNGPTHRGLLLSSRPWTRPPRPSRRCRWSCSTAPAVCLDITGFAPRTDITADDLDRVEAESLVSVQPGDIVLFYTGTLEPLRAGTSRYLTEFMLVLSAIRPASGSSAAR